MTLEEFFPATYAWADAHGTAILAAAVAVPVVGTIAARIGKAGRTDRDGRMMASALVGLSVIAVMIEVAALVIAHSIGASVMDANVQLLVAPGICLVGSLIGIRWVFPLNELGSVRTVVDLAVFAAAAGGLVWFLSKFRGWGILFVGSFVELVVVFAIALLLLRRLFRRAFVGRRSDGARAAID